MDKKIIAFLITAVIVIAGISVYLLFQPKDKSMIGDKQDNLNNGVKSAPELSQDESIEQESGVVEEQNQQVDRKSIDVLINDKGFSPGKVTISEDTSIKFENKSGGDFYFLITDDMPPMPNILLSNTNSIIEFKEGQYKLVNKNNTTQTLEIVVSK